MVRKALCSSQVFFIAGNLVGICVNFVHSAMFHTHHCFLLLVRQICCQVNSPVAEFQKHIFGLFAFAIQPGIAQTGKHFMQVVKGRPRTKIHSKIAFFKC